MTRLKFLSILVPASAVLLVSLGCDSKTTLEAPLAAKTPGDILQHLRYLAATKDYKHIILMAPVSENVVIPSAWWFNSQAKGLGLNLTLQEETDLGVLDLKNKLDNLPRVSSPDYTLQDARRAFYAGIYRLVKGFSPEDWNKMYVMSVQMSPSSVDVTDVTLGFDNQAKLVVSCVKTPEGSYGVANIQYKVGLAIKK